MEGKNPEGNFKALGRQLKALRSRAHESLAEASGAVEIDVRELASFELGDKCPNEEVLLLLISHFGARDDEAIKLWEMAGYGAAKIPVAHMSNEVLANFVSTENRVLYTDIVDVTVNNFGVIMNFMQNGGPNAAPMPVARVGMSREHAKSVMEILKTTLSQLEQHGNSKQPSTDVRENRADS